MIVELYKFTAGTTTFAYTNDQAAVEYNGVTFEPAYIDRDSIKATQQIARSGLSVHLPRDAGLVALYLRQPPMQIVELEIYQQTELATALIWVGRVMTVEREDSEAVAHCESIFTSTQRAGLRARIQRNCRHALYDKNCTINKNLFALNATILTVTGNIINAAAFSSKPDGWFTGGLLQFGAGTPEWRTIVDHDSGAAIVSIDWPLTLNPGDAVIAYAGCDHLFDTCKTKFSNELNYGGEPSIPKLNPFGDTPIF